MGQPHQPPGSSLLLSGTRGIRGRRHGLQRGWTGLRAHISEAGRRQAASWGARTLVWETEANCFSPLEEPFPGDMRPPEAESPLAVVQSLILLGVKSSARRVTPEVPSTPEKAGVVLNELPGFCGRVLPLAAFCRHGYAQKAPMIPHLCVRLR